MAYSSFLLLLIMWWNLHRGEEERAGGGGAAGVGGRVRLGGGRGGRLCRVQFCNMSGVKVFTQCGCRCRCVCVCMCVAVSTCVHMYVCECGLCVCVCLCRSSKAFLLTDIEVLFPPHWQGFCCCCVCVCVVCVAFRLLLLVLVLSSPSAAASSAAIRVACENPIIKTRHTQPLLMPLLLFHFFFCRSIFSHSLYTHHTLFLPLSLTLFHSLSLLSSFILSLSLLLCLSFYCLSLFQFCVLFHFVVSTRAWRTILESLSMQVEINNVRIFNEQRVEGWGGAVQGLLAGLFHGDCSLKTGPARRICKLISA